jgi:hypothetical protein
MLSYISKLEESDMSVDASISANAFVDHFHPSF